MRGNSNRPVSKEQEISERAMTYQTVMARFTAILLVICFLCSACDRPGEAGNSSETSNGQADFEAFLTEQFVESVQADSITLHYTLAHPEVYGIKETEATLGAYTKESYQENVYQAQELLEQMQQFSYEELTEEEQMTYDILTYVLELTLASEPYFLYGEQLSPTTGLQAQLPILLAEYKFYTARDVENYLAILSCVYEYYEQILTVEKLRSEAGLFLCDKAVEDIVEQCRDFIKSPEDNFLITAFEERLEGLTELSEDERLAYIYDNKQAVKDSIIPAYEQLIEVLESLKGTGTNEKGLCYFPEGKAYYEWLVKNNTGSDWTVNKMKSKLEQTIQESVGRIQLAVKAEPDILEQAETPLWQDSTPEEILVYLQEAMLADYPAIGDTSYSVKYVDPSLQEHLSPAFFLTPALDDWENLSIYINPSETNGNQDGIFTMLGHEGFPGHLYENVRFNQTEPSPIRQLLSFGGYSEGWATYAEYSCYDYAGVSENLATLLRYFELLTLAICGRVDIGINYDGWDLTKTAQYLMDYGLIEDEPGAEGLYWSCIEEPANTLDYVIGYLEFMELRSQAEEKAEETGTDFDPVSYHAALLDLGPAPFPVLRKWME